MSGKIKLKVRKGKSLDTRYEYYPEAYWEITGEKGEVINISPSYLTLKQIMIDFRKHELIIDETRLRKTYSSKLIKMLEELLIDVKQTKLTEFDKENVDEIYLY